MKVLSVRRAPQISRSDLAALEDGYAAQAAAPELLASVGHELAGGQISKATGDAVMAWCMRFYASMRSDPFRRIGD